VTLATNTDAMREVSRDRSFNRNNVNASSSLLDCEIAVPVGLYGVGLFKGDPHARENVFEKHHVYHVARALRAKLAI
jgi:hypothetical protein